MATRVRELGFTDLTAFNEAHWGDTWMQLAARIDPAEAAQRLGA